MKKIFAIFLLISFAFLLSCGNSNEKNDYKNETQLTERIQYDVLIKSPDPDYDWWAQNIEGSKRETFVKTIYDLAESGKVKAYSGDYLYTLLTPDEVKATKTITQTKNILDPDDPSKSHDTTLTQELDMHTITKVRFLEEWYLDEKKLSFDKKVCGVMLLRENYGDSLELRGYTPLFWIFFDDSYPAKLK